MLKESKLGYWSEASRRGLKVFFAGSIALWLETRIYSGTMISGSAVEEEFANFIPGPRSFFVEDDHGTME